MKPLHIALFLGIFLFTACDGSNPTGPELDPNIVITTTKTDKVDQFTGETTDVRKCTFIAKVIDFRPFVVDSTSGYLLAIPVSTSWKDTIEVMYGNGPPEKYATVVAHELQFYTSQDGQLEWWYWAEQFQEDRPLGGFSL